MSIAPDLFENLFDKVFKSIRDQQKQTIVLELDRKFIDDELFQNFPLSDKEFSQLKERLESDDEFLQTMIHMMKFYVYRIRSKGNKDINFPYVSLL